VNKKWETFQAVVVDGMNSGIIPVAQGRGDRREVCKQHRRAEIRATGMASIRFVRRGEVKKKGMLKMNCKTSNF